MITSMHLVAANTIEKVNNSIYGAAQMTGLDYVEYNSTRSDEDQQTGFLWGGKLGSTTTIYNIYLNLDMYSTIGKTQYKGGLENSPNATIFHHATNNINNIDAKLGYSFYMNNNAIALTPFTMFGYRYWKRRSNESENPEIYTTMYLSAGLLFQYKLATAFVLNITGTAGSTINPKINNTRDNNLYRQGESGIFSASINLNYFITESLSILSGVEGVYFKYKKSNTVNGDDEPDSTTKQLNAYLGLSYSF